MSKSSADPSLLKYDDDDVGDLTHKNLEDNEIELDSEMLNKMIETDYKTFIPEVSLRNTNTFSF